MSIEQDLPSCKLGDTLIQPWQFLNDADSTPIPQEANVYTFTMKLDKSVDDADSDVLVTITVPAGADADNGLVSARVEASATALLQPTSYNYELKQVITAAPEDTIATLFYGKIKMEF